jgi:hypothetical protein
LFEPGAKHPAAWPERTCPPSFSTKRVLDDLEISCEASHTGRTPRKEVVSCASGILGLIESEIDGVPSKVSKSTKAALDRRWMLQTDTVLIVVQARQTWKEASLRIRMCKPGAFQPQPAKFRNLEAFFAYD